MMGQAILYARTAAHEDTNMAGVTFTLTEARNGIVTVGHDGTRAIIIADGSRTGEWKEGTTKATFGRGTVSADPIGDDWQDGAGAYLIGDDLAFFLSRDIESVDWDDPAPPDDLKSRQKQWDTDAKALLGARPT